MRTYRVVTTDEAKSQMREYLSYIKYELKNPEAARAVRDDWKETTKALKSVAASIGDPDSSKLIKRNLKKMHFRRHNYVMLFRIKNNVVEVVNIYHNLQDYENY